MASEDAFLSFSPREPLRISEGGDKGELNQPRASWEVLPCLRVIMDREVCTSGALWFGWPSSSQQAAIWKP